MKRHLALPVSPFRIPYVNQFNSVYLYSAFYNKIVSRCFTESETRSWSPQVIAVARRKVGSEGKRE